MPKTTKDLIDSFSESLERLRGVHDLFKGKEHELMSKDNREMLDHVKGGAFEDPLEEIHRAISWCICSK